MTESPFIVWRDIFAVGHEELDAEHRRLVKAINKIHSAECAGRTPDQLRPMLNALFVAAEQHFERENSIMRKIGPDAPVTSEAIDKHISAHERELSNLRSIIGSIGPVIDSAEPKLSYELRHWFVEHSIKYDSHLKMLFQSV